MVPLKTQIFWSTQWLRRFLNSVIAGEGMFFVWRSSIITETARCTGMRVNMLTASKESNLALAGNLCVASDLTSSISNS